MTEPPSTPKPFSFPLTDNTIRPIPFHKVGGSYIYWIATGLAEIVDKITAIDEFTVQIRLKTAYAPFIYTIAITPFSIVSPTAAQKWGDEFSNNPVGTGPVQVCAVGQKR